VRGEVTFLSWLLSLLTGLPFLVFFLGFLVILAVIVSVVVSSKRDKDKQENASSSDRHGPA